MTPALAAPENPSFTEQAQSISKLRTQVSLLQEEIRDERTDLQSRLRTLEAQRSDVALQLRRQKAMTQEVLERIVKLKRQSTPETASDEIDAVLLRSAEQLKSDIQSSIPYRHQERIQGVDEILNARQNQKLTAMQAATRLWAIAEDEARLNRENQLDTMTLNLADKDLLVDIVRIGMMFMLYQTKEGVIGVWSEKSGWTAHTNNLQELESLFRQFRKGIRTGTFFVPINLEEI